jgi:hypothetical protein
LFVWGIIRIQARKSETLSQLYARIYDNRSALAVAFEQLDDNKDGYLTKKQWVDGEWRQ